MFRLIKLHRSCVGMRFSCVLFCYVTKVSLGISASFLTEISVGSPRKLFNFIISKNLFRIKVSKSTLRKQKQCWSCVGMRFSRVQRQRFDQTSPRLPTLVISASCIVETSVRSPRNYLFSLSKKIHFRIKVSKNT